MIASEPTRIGAASTGRCVALLSAPTTHTKLLPCKSVSARSGTTIFPSPAGRLTRTRANMPGRSALVGFGNSARARMVAVVGSTTRSMKTHLPASGSSEPSARIK